MMKNNRISCAVAPYTTRNRATLIFYIATADATPMQPCIEYLYLKAFSGLINATMGATKAQHATAKVAQLHFL